MRPWLLTLAAAGLLLGCGCSTAAPTKEDPMTDEKQLAPEFSLPGSDGQTYTLADYRGKQAVVVAWFPIAFTGG